MNRKIISFTKIIFLSAILLHSIVTKASLTYEAGEFMIGVEDVGMPDSDLDNNDVVLSIRYLMQYDNACSKPTGDCLRQLVLITTPLAAGATHSLGVRIFPYGNSDNTTYDVIEHRSGGTVSTTNHFYETRLYEGISDMFTCGASSFVNTFSGSANCQGKTRVHSFYFDANSLEISDSSNIDNFVADLIHIENYTLCQGIDTGANDSEQALTYSIYGSTAGVPAEYNDFYTGYGLANDTSGAGADVGGFGKCDAKNGNWHSTCPSLISAYMGSLGSLPSTVIELNDSGVFSHPTLKVAMWDSTNDTFDGHWLEEEQPGSPTIPAITGNGMAELFSQTDYVGAYQPGNWQELQKLRYYGHFIDTSTDSGRFSGGGGAVPTGASCGSPP